MKLLEHAIGKTTNDMCDKNGHMSKELIISPHLIRLALSYRNSHANDTTERGQC